MIFFKIIGMGKFGTALQRCIVTKGGSFSDTEYDWLIPAVPSFAVKEVVKNELNKNKNLKVLIVSKGMSENKFLSEVFDEMSIEYAVLVGPHLADELKTGLPTRSTIASKKYLHFEQIKDYFPNCSFSDNPDLICLAAVFKNIAAFLCGMANGLDLGSNARACIIQESLLQIVDTAFKLNFTKKNHNTIELNNKLSKENEINKEKDLFRKDFLQPGILGDLILTCTSTSSRNFQSGSALIRGEKVDFLVESVHSAKLLLNRLKDLNHINLENASIIKIAAETDFRSVSEIKNLLISLILRNKGN